MTRSAAFDGRFPPTDRTFRGAITMRLASGGADVDELVEEFIELAADWDDNFPDDAPPVAPEDVPAVVDEVVAEYQRVVTELSPDAIGLMSALDALFAGGILYSYGDAFETSDAMEALQDAFDTLEAQGVTLKGYLYSLVGDLDELVLAQRLEINFGTFDGDSDGVPALAARALEILTAAGLKASWSGDPGDPIVVAPMLVNAPLAVEDDHDHDHD